VGIGLFWLSQQRPFEELPPAVGRMAPELDLADLAGQMVSLSGMKGKVVILSFWATWCPICKEQLKFYEKLYEELKPEGLRVLAIATDDVTIEDVKALGLTYPVLKIIDRVKKAYGNISDVPATFVIDKDGIIVKKFKRRLNKKSLKQEVLRLLKEK
jgi:peroxiredoxin